MSGVEERGEIDSSNPSEVIKLSGGDRSGREYLQNHDDLSPASLEFAEVVERIWADFLRGEISPNPQLFRKPFTVT
jgi:hypothetical protein